MNYYLVHQGRGNKFAKEAYQKKFIGIGFLHDLDLNKRLHDDWREFNKEFIPIIMKTYPEKTKVSAGLAGGNLWTVTKGIAIGDRVLNPMGDGTYAVGEVSGDYQYSPDHELAHRRPVEWVGNIRREDMSEALSNSAGSIMTAFNLSKYADELNSLVEGKSAPLILSDETVEDPNTFALEKHLEDFLVHNWAQTLLGKKYDIYKEQGEIIGQQYPTDVGPIDILAVSKDGKELLVVELKKGRVGDVVVGQILRYMGYVQDQLAEKDQKVRGLIIAHEPDEKISFALKMTQGINFMTYTLSFKLIQDQG